MSNVRQEQSYPQEPFLLSVDDLTSHLNTSVDSGLSNLVAQQNQQKYGENRLDGEDGVHWYAILMKQISNAMILVLILAMALSYGVQDFIEGGVITAVIVLNVVIGFYQEFQAEKKMDALRNLSSPSAAVIRNGDELTIPSGELVPGDIVSIKTGDTVPADLRLFEVMNLECDEAILTGEALPVAKEVEFDAPPGTEKAELGTGDRLNMAYSSSAVTKGRGRGIVVYTAMSTAIGGIAASMQGKKRKPNRSMSRKDGGKMQPVKGGVLRFYDGIAKFLGLTEATPLQIKLSKLAYILFFCALLLAVIVFGVNKFNVTTEIAIYAISTGIAIIPESLIAVLTVTMVVGMTQMQKRKVVVRQLSALEALGGVTHICSDKTGTLTQGKMVTRKAWIPGAGTYTVEDSNNAADPTQGRVTYSQEVSVGKETGDDIEKARETSATRIESPDNIDVAAQQSPALTAFVDASALCNLATVRQVEEHGQKMWKTTGDPTEIALQVFSHRFGRSKPSLEGEHGWRQTMEYPFDSSIKRMSVVYTRPDESQSVIFCKGAVERIIDLCTTVGIDEHQQPMTDQLKESILEQMSSLASQGLRVLAIARKYRPETITAQTPLERDVIESELCLLGLAGLYDPPRLETRAAVQECLQAGISVCMLTGDHPSTATAIGREVGIIPSNTASLSAAEKEGMTHTATTFSKMSDAEIDALPALPLIIARCAPETKVRMIEALHRRSAFCAMTGDGVNDSPSLKLADVGIAMGLNGSDVAKSAADIVLTDDNFSSIVNAVEEGRRMFDNIQKFILHLLISNVGEVILLICGLAFQDRDGFSVFPLSPLQILWVNMLTAGFPAFGLGREKAASDIMRRPPRDGKKGVFTWEVVVDMLVYGTILGIVTLSTFVFVVFGPGPDGIGVECNRGYSDSCRTVFRARATVFAELTWCILISAWELKSLRRSMFALDPTNTTSKFPFFADVYENKFLFYSVVLGALSVFPTVYIPGLNQNVFKHTGISWEWSVAILCTLIFVTGMEAWKAVKRSTGWFADATVEGQSMGIQGMMSMSAIGTTGSTGSTHCSEYKAEFKEPV